MEVSLIPQKDALLKILIRADCKWESSLIAVVLCLRRNKSRLRPSLKCSQPPQKMWCLRRSSQNTKTEHFSSLVQAAVDLALPPAWRCCFASFVLGSWCDKILFFSWASESRQIHQTVVSNDVTSPFFVFCFYFLLCKPPSSVQPDCQTELSSICSISVRFSVCFSGKLMLNVWLIWRIRQHRIHEHEFLLLFKFSVLVVQFSLMETHFQGPIIYTSSDI